MDCTKTQNGVKKKKKSVKDHIHVCVSACVCPQATERTDGKDGVRY